MSTLKRKDNDAEVAVRRLLYAAGYRYRVHYPVPGAPRRTIDIAFTRVKIAIFIDGCFWHGCPEHGTRPTSNPEWWAVKLAANRARDDDTSDHLKCQGWHVMRFWEHERPFEVSALIAGFNAPRPPAVSRTSPRAVLAWAGGPSPVDSQP